MHYAHKVESLSRTAHWELRFADGKASQHASVVLANGHHITQFTQTASLPVYPVGGQVSHIPTAPELSKLRQVLCYDGYATPQNPSNGHHCIGASYHRGETDMQYSEADQQQNRQRLLDCFPNASWAKEVDVSEGGLGSRGLCSAPLLAEVLAAQMSDEPVPLDRVTLAGLNPNRLWVRKLLKGKRVK